MAMMMPEPTDNDSDPRAAAVRDAATRAHAACVERRARVLAHPDIAARLTRPPLRFSRPEVWNGYVPPELFREQRSDSPQRVAILAILDDVAERDQAEVL